MGSLRTAPVIMRALLGALLATLFAVRLLSPIGFMPSFEHGSVTIVACPDYDPAPAPRAHYRHHGSSKKVPQQCPYAGAAGAATAVEPPLLAALVLLVAALLLGRTYHFLERHRARERPPLRGPPLPA